MRKNTKSALLLSVVSIIVCCTMLLGTTMAWFTDSVTSSVNTIVAGNLDIELVHGDKNVDEDYNIFPEDILWEPGVVYYETLEIKNEGTLALQYDLSLTWGDCNTVEDEEGNEHNLSEVLTAAIVEGEIDDDAKREDIIASKTFQPIADVSLEGMLDADNADLTDAKTSDTVTLIVYWEPSDEDNNYNVNNGKETSNKEPLYINLGITLLATQLEAEKDSFDNTYDEDAELGNVWDGTTTDNTWYNTTDTVFTLTTPEQLADLAQIVNAGTDTFTGKTVKLGADMNLNNEAWTPIGSSGNGWDAKFNGSFDGNGYTISNLYVTGTTGLGLFGYVGSSAHIEGVHINGAYVSGQDYLGAVLGTGYLAENCLKNNIVENATIIATPYLTNDGYYDGGAKAGVVAGYAINGNITGNVAKNSTVYAYRDLGGIVGMAAGENHSITVSGNTIENVTLLYVSVSDKYEGDKVNSNMGDIVGRVGSNVTVEDNVGDTTAATSVSTNEALKNALANEATIVLDKGEYSLPTLAGYEGVTIVGNGAVVGGENASTGFGSNFGKNTTIKGVTFSGTANGVRWSYAKGGDTVFEDCTFAGDSTYGFHIDESNGANFTFNNCTFVGFNAFAGDLASVTFNNCAFLSNGNYGHTNIWSVGYFNNCTWGDNTSVGPGNGSSAKLYFNNIEESYHHEFVGSAASLVAFAESVNIGKDSWSGQAVLLVNDIDLADIDWEPIGQTGATEFKGIFDGQGYTISNLTIDSSAETGANYSSGLFGWTEDHGTNIVIKNVNVDGATVKGNHNVAVIMGYTYGADIINCHVSNATIVCNHENDDACGDKVGIIGGYVADESKVTDCSATDCTVSAGRDAGQLIGAGYNVSVSGCSATNVTVSATGECTGANVNEAIIGRVMG